MSESSCGSTPSPAFGVGKSLAILTGAQWYLVVLICISLRTHDAASLCPCLTCHVYIFFGEASVKVFGPFLFFFLNFILEREAEEGQRETENPQQHRIPHSAQSPMWGPWDHDLGPNQKSDAQMTDLLRHSHFGKTCQGRESVWLAKW